MRLELVKGPLVEAWGMIRSEFWDIYIMMLKVEALAFAVIAAFIVAAALAAVALFQASAAAALALAAVIALAGLFLGSVVVSAAYNYIDAKSGKKRISFPESLRANALPMLGYDIVCALVFLLVFAPFMGLLFILYTSGGIGEGAARIL